MLIIRFSKTGKKNQPQYRIVLAEKSFPVQGRFLEILGNYNPHSKEILLKEEKIKEWISKGAGCSDSVFNLLVSKGVIRDKKRKVLIKRKGKKDGEEGKKINQNKPEEKLAEESDINKNVEVSKEPASSTEKNQEKNPPTEVKSEPVIELAKAESAEAKEEKKE